MDISGATAFITGGAGGIGVGLAEALVGHGARVVLADVDGDAARAAAGLLGEAACAVQLDVASRASWVAAAAEIEAGFGPIDILCNNAGIGIAHAPFDQVTEDDFARLVGVNLAGVYHGIATFVPGMRGRGKGHVVNTASALGLLPNPMMSAYSATKAAVIALSETLRAELAETGIGVSVVCPAGTRSKMALRNIATMAPEKRAAMEADMMEPIWVGRAVADAIARDDLYAITHPESRGLIAARFDRILAAFGEPAQPGFRVAK